MKKQPPLVFSYYRYKPYIQYTSRLIPVNSIVFLPVIEKLACTF
ncbi:MAG: hypothetical protein K0R59_432 [Sphingobacterium sp.]|jgi:hypothetical protein|nr:hypothetical protein [Sphingobacterium sp.]